MSTRLPQIQRLFRRTSLHVRAVLVYSGINLVSDDRLRMFEDLKRRFSSEDDYFGFLPYNLTSVDGWLTGADEGPGVGEVNSKYSIPDGSRSPMRQFMA